MALSSAAILAVYTVGYVRTESADAQLNGGAVPASRVVAAAPVPIPTSTMVPLPTGGSAASRGNGFFLPNTPTPAATPTTGAPVAVAASLTTPATSATSATRAVPAITTNAPTATTASGVPTAVPFAPPRAIATAPAAPVFPTTLPTATATIAPTAAPRVAAPTGTTAVVTTGKYKDGSYTGTGTSRRGDIEVEVTVQGGKITAAEITTCGTVYSCSRIAALPGQVVARQSATVDRVTGATYSTQAYQLAVKDALAQAGGA